jgi:hypothetical protein
MLKTIYRKINTSATTVEDKDILTKQLINPPVRVIDLQFPLGTTVTARNKFGVTIKDAFDAIYKTQKKKVSLFIPKSRGIYRAPTSNTFLARVIFTPLRKTNVSDGRPTMSLPSRT